MITDRWQDLIPLRQKNSEEYVPSIEQIIDYAQFIGLEFPGDQNLLYLAKQGISASLPEEWQACQTISGDMVYRNLNTKQIQTEHPLDLIYRKKVFQIKNQPLSDYFSQEFDLTKKSQFLSAIQQDKAQFSESNLSDYFQPIGKGNQFKSNSDESLKNYKEKISLQSGTKSFQTKKEQILRPKGSLKNQNKPQNSLSQNASSVKTNQNKNIFKLNLKEKAALSSNIEKQLQQKKSPQSMQIYASQNYEPSKNLHNSQTVFNNQNSQLFNHTDITKYFQNEFIALEDGKLKQRQQREREMQKLEAEIQKLTMEEQLKSNLLKQLKDSNQTKLALLKVKMQAKINKKRKKHNLKPNLHISQTN